MASALAEAHIRSEARLRAVVRRAVENAWRGLPDYHEQAIPGFLRQVLPVVEAGKRASVSLTDGYLARALGRRPLGVDLGDLDLRNGTPPADVYRRPFTNVWTSLAAGNTFDAAVASGLARAAGSATMDVQLAMARTAQVVGATDPRIQRFQRVADADACEFCQAVDGAVLNSDDPMPLHNGCGCGVEPLEEAPAITPPPSSVAVRDHGELGPMLLDPSHAFTGPSDV